MARSLVRIQPELLPRGADRGLALPLVPALGELLDRLAAEGLQIVGLAARDQAAVDVDLLVHPFAAGVADVGLQAGPRRERATAYDVRLDERPGAVADRRDRLAALEE